MSMDPEDPMYTVVIIMTFGANNQEGRIMSHMLREQQQATHQNFVFSNVRNMMRPIGIGVIVVMDIGITKALTVQ